jgi:ABC-2 type transport system ATP-binding protein
LLLDQPTLGLDCDVARQMRTFIRQWVREDSTRTVMLATNDMAEANELCDRIAILDGGRVAACDTPSALAGEWHVAPPLPDSRVHGAAALEAAFLAIIGRRGWASA